MGRFVDLCGKCFGRLTVVSRAETNIYGKPAWVCACICGATCVVAGSSLRMGVTASCGCAQKELAAGNLRKAATTHGMHGTPEYYRWASMKLRCYVKTHYAYPRYGGRGITVCDRWRNNFEHFLVDVGNRPTDRHSLDRIDNDGNYEPNNVRWATNQEQANNRSSNVNITYNGETRTQAEWARLAGITPEGIAYRHKHGKDLL
jgi:hypothetical protein